MKNRYKSIVKTIISIVTLGSLALMPACNDNPDEFVLADGQPEVQYVRKPDALSADSLVTHAFMGNTIAIIGNNMNSVKEVWFNDQKSILNSSYITPTALIVTIPTRIPTLVTNKMYLVNKNNDTVKYDFGVDVPSPLISSMKCEYVATGDVAVIRGNYFLSVAGSNNPEVTFTPNIKATEIVSYTLNEIAVKVPSGAQAGPVSVSSRYGTSRSVFHFRDNRGIILDWDNTNLMADGDRELLPTPTR